MEVENIPIAEVIPYSKNPRKNDKAVDIVAKSIKEFGFKVPIILDKNNEIIAGHTRLKAAYQLGLEEVPVIWADDLSEDQVKAFRIMDNKSQDYAEWDWDLLKEEMTSLKENKFNLDLTGFDKAAREVVDLPEDLGEVPDVELEGALKKFSNVIVIVGMDNDEHEKEVREFINLPAPGKTMTSTDFIKIIKEKAKE